MEEISSVWRKERPTGPETLFRFEVWGSHQGMVSDSHQPQRCSSVLALACFILPFSKSSPESYHTS